MSIPLNGYFIKRAELKDQRVYFVHQREKNRDRKSGPGQHSIQTSKNKRGFCVTQLRTR